MYVAQLKLWNFRKFGNQDQFNVQNPHCIINFNRGLNVLIGENDSGKTAIVDAIKLVLKTHSNDWLRLEQEDFYTDAIRLRIECIIEGLEDDTEAQHFTEWLGWSGTGTDAKPYLRLILDASRNSERILPYDVKAGADANGHLLTAEAKELLRCTYLRPLRDAKWELVPKRNSRSSQILIAHKAFEGQHNTHPFVGLYRDLNAEIEAYFKGQNKNGEDLHVDQQGGKILKSIIDKYLQQFRKMDSKILMEKTDLKGILESLCLLFDVGYNLGLGSHNLLSIATELLHLQKDNWEGIRLGLIEEIEAHLHPQVQLQVIETIQKEAQNVQLIFTTHSPNIGSKIPLENLIICQGDKTFPMGADYTMLKKTDYSFLMRFLDVTKSNLFFAKGVILIEGWGEELILPELSNKIKINLTEKGVCIVNVGNTAFLRYCGIFKRKIGPQMTTPVAVLTDVDVLPIEAAPTKNIPHPDDPNRKQEIPLTQAEISNAIIEATARKQKYNGGPVRSYVSPFWTLEYCIARSVKLRKILYRSVLEALREQREDDGVADLRPYNNAITNLETYFNNWQESDELIAYKIYAHIKNGEHNLPNVKKEAVSKTIVAQRFAENLKRAQIDDLTTEPSITYLLDAIRYAATI
ncbi:ATP-dependent endonuclease [Chitinophaga sp. sic0106]|uniref:ATP-dependent nuclease n=1 Tax=Chitinophaga sp. sic0106 TaxID=2854785 RepID=UPI001C43E544|nr:AAA family ATPase [Chitinophaga sp. sic0106]MBV7532863.1 AAA family ATPase [Chitinophaga sp. sic0106]